MHYGCKCALYDQFMWYDCCYLLVDGQGRTGLCLSLSKKRVIIALTIIRWSFCAKSCAENIKFCNQVLDAHWSCGPHFVGMATQASEHCIPAKFNACNLHSTWFYDATGLVRPDFFSHGKFYQQFGELFSCWLMWTYKAGNPVLAGNRLGGYKIINRIADCVMLDCGGNGVW